MPTIPTLEWPDDEFDVEYVGLTHSAYVTVANAIDDGRVKCIRHTVNSWYHEWTFDFDEYRYELSAESERLQDNGPLRYVPYRITKIAKHMKDQDGNPSLWSLRAGDLPPRATQYESWGAF